MVIYRVKSVIVSRKPNKDREEPWSAFIGLFQDNNPHLTGRAPSQVLEFKKVEKVRIRDLMNISFYLRGNDVVINNLQEVSIIQEGDIVTVTGKQELPRLG